MPYTNVVSDISLFLPESLFHSIALTKHIQSLPVSSSVPVSLLDSPSQSVLKLDEQHLELTCGRQPLPTTVAT